MKWLNYKYNEKIIKLIISLPFIWVFSGLLIYNHGKTEFITISILSILIICYKYKLQFIWSNLKHSNLVKLLLFTAVYFIFLRMFIDVRSSFVKIYLILVLIFLFFPIGIVKEIQNRLYLLVFLGAISSFIFSVYNTFYLNLGREWPINPIPYSTVIAVLSLLSLYYFVNLNNIKYKVLMIVSFFMTLMALIFGETRGCWGALIIASIFFIYMNKEKILNNKKNIILLMLSTILITSPFLNKIESRLKYSNSELALIKSGDNSSSFGLRLQMWKAAIYIIPKAPFFGVSEKHYNYKQDLANKGIINQDAVSYFHYHNQYLDLLVKYGFITFIIVMLSFFYPLYNFFVSKKGCYELSFLVCILYSICALTDVPLNHPISFIIYYTLIYITSFDTNCKSRNIRINTGNN